VKGFLRGGKESDAAAEEARRIEKREQEQEQVAEQIPTDFSSEELREFLEADGLEVSADPAFKERLRRKLWELVERRRHQETDPTEGER
jgi:hypothetical protein